MSPNGYIHLFMLEKHKYVMDVWYNVKIAYVLFKLLISRRSPSFAPDSDVIFHAILFFNGNKDDTKKSNSAGASNRSFCSIFIKRFDHSETLLTKCRPKKALSAGWQGGGGFSAQSAVSCFTFKYVIKATEMFHGKQNLK